MNSDKNPESNPKPSQLQPATSPGPGMLTPAEVEQLRQDLKTSGDKALEAFRKNPIV